MIYFLLLIFNECVNNLGFWQFRFHGVHFNHDSQNSFFSTSWFTDTKNGQSCRHENKLPPPLFSILLQTRTVHSELSFIIILFSVIYASLFFAVRFVVTFEKLAKTFQFLKAALQDHISISFQFTQLRATHINTNHHKHINSSKLIVQKIVLI